jgi:hypothetical protein
MLGLFSHQQVSRRLRIRLAIFLAIGIAILGFIVRDAARGDLAWWLAALGILVGTAAGTALGRMLTIKWHETREEAVFEMDVAGGIGIALYIAFDLSREWLLGRWVHGAALTALSLAILGGALIGRYLGMALSVKRVLKANAPEA